MQYVCSKECGTVNYHRFSFKGILFSLSPYFPAPLIFNVRTDDILMKQIEKYFIHLPPVFIFFRFFCQYLDSLLRQNRIIQNVLQHTVTDATSVILTMQRKICRHIDVQAAKLQTCLRGENSESLLANSRFAWRRNLSSCF